MLAFSRDTDWLDALAKVRSMPEGFVPYGDGLPPIVPPAPPPPPPTVICPPSVDLQGAELSMALESSHVGYVGYVSLVGHGASDMHFN